MNVFNEWLNYPNPSPPFLPLSFHHHQDCQSMAHHPRNINNCPANKALDKPDWTQGLLQPGHHALQNCLGFWNGNFVTEFVSGHGQGWYKLHNYEASNQTCIQGPNLWGQHCFANISAIKARIFMVVNYYLVSLSLKFDEDPCISARTRVVNARICDKTCVRAFTTCVRAFMHKYSWNLKLKHTR